MTPSLKTTPGSAAFLASVVSAAEAVTAAAHGADIIDAKNPMAGALGALPVATVAAIRAAVPEHVSVSATIGDLVPEPARVSAAAEEMARAGQVDFVKIGFFPGGDNVATIRALGRLRLSRARLVGLLLADAEPDFNLIEEFAEAGFRGVMLDTANKASGALPDVLSLAQIGQFVARAQRAQMFAGLAGALRLAHIPVLRSLGPDIVGFRGALCRAGQRTGDLEASLVRRVADVLAQPEMTGSRVAGRVAVGGP